MGGQPIQPEDIRNRRTKTSDAARNLESRAQKRVERVTASWRRKPLWWREVAYVAAFYGLYSLIRNLHGSVLSVRQATQHARSVVQFEHSLHMFNEERIQAALLPYHWIIKFLNIWYGTAHFAVTLGILLWLFHVQTERYRKWRNVIFFTTGLSLLGYVLYPLAPPRLLPASYGFVDTLDKFGGLWNFDSGNVEKVSNQYAAMPSLHVAWALWSALAILPVLKHATTRTLIAIYPAITITAIIVSANHYWVDVFGGFIAFSAAYVIAEVFEKQLVLHQMRLIKGEATERAGQKSSGLGQLGDIGELDKLALPRN